MIQKPEITILGVGNYLFRDEGFGIRVVEQLEKAYRFPDHIHVIDGGVLGINLLGILSEPKHLIVVDAIRNQSPPGTIHRLEGDQIPRRILAKNSLHQVDLLEALTLCQALDHVPETVILGVEPHDIETLRVELTAPIKAQIRPMMALVLAELDRLGATYEKRNSENVPGDSVQNHSD